MITTFFGTDTLGSSAALVVSLLVGFGFGLPSNVPVLGAPGS
jgi:hypothetical protein